MILQLDPTGKRETLLVYDRQADPGEQRPLSSPYPDRVTEIAAALRARREAHPLAKSLSADDDEVRDLGYIEELKRLGYVGEE